MVAHLIKNVKNVFSIIVRWHWALTSHAFCDFVLRYSCFIVFVVCSIWKYMNNTRLKRTTSSPNGLAFGKYLISSKGFLGYVCSLIIPTVQLELMKLLLHLLCLLTLFYRLLPVSITARILFETRIPARFNVTLTLKYRTKVFQPEIIV